MKYITPSIEVVSFNPADAARIGMQWWGSTNFPGDPFSPAVSGYSPSNYDYMEYITVSLTSDGVDCSSVQLYTCFEESGMFSGASDKMIIADDGKSC